MNTWKDAVRRVVGAPARPFVRYFNRRFEDVHGHLDNEAEFVNTRLAETAAATRALQERIATDVQVISELTVGLERLADRFAERVDALLEALERLPPRD
jgi:hypothetical protein